MRRPVETPRKRGLTRYPLRKVVGVKRVTYGVVTIRHDLMECGHHLAPSADIYGRTSPARRRCWKCPER